MAEKTKDSELTTAQRVARDLLRDAKELRESAARQERDKELCTKESRFVTAIRAKRKMADELEQKAKALTQ